MKDNTKRTMCANPNLWDYNEPNSTTEHEQAKPVNDNPVSLYDHIRRPLVRLRDYVKL